MELQEIRGLAVDELKTRIRQWKEELFRSRFKAESTEAKDTSVFRKLRRNIARGFTILSEKNRGVVVEAKTPEVSTAPSDKPTAKKASSAGKTKRAKAAPSKAKKPSSKKK